MVSRTGYGGELGYELFCRPEHAPDLWEVLSPMSATPFGVGILECFRVEAGLIVLDYDYTAHERTPFDLSLDKMVALGKVASRGVPPSRRWPRAAPPSQDPADRGGRAPRLGVEVTRDGEPVGTLTSPAVSPAFGPIALAVLESGGRRRRVGRGGLEGGRRATVAPLAIYDPEKRRPRS